MNIQEKQMATKKEIKRMLLSFKASELEEIDNYVSEANRISTLGKISRTDLIRAAIKEYIKNNKLEG
jgi:metal-responsive CopG/Arc/MetJ family transcriptional regulator